MLMCCAKLIPIRLPGLAQTLPHCLRRSLTKREIRSGGRIQGRSGLHMQRPRSAATTTSYMLKSMGVNV